MKSYEFPRNYQAWIEDALRPLGHSLKEPKKLAKAILQSSDNFQDEASRSQWTDKGFSAAYLAYFFPLNYIRSLRVLDTIKNTDFFAGIETMVDFGCGPGTLTKVLNDQCILFPKFLGLDSEEGLKKFYLSGLSRNTAMEFHTKFTPPKENFAIAASYVLNELDVIPEFFYSTQALIVLEPSTKQASHKFQELRSQLIEKGYKIHAPCPHIKPCPLKQSKKDWCHDRAYWEQPAWFTAIEEHLPIKNESVTLTYLVAHKNLPTNETYARIVGDPSNEKGKTRWLLCHNQEREFLSFLHRHGEPPTLHRGDRIIIEEFEKKGNEIRIQISPKLI